MPKNAIRLGYPPAELCHALPIARRLIEHRARPGHINQALRLPHALLTELYHEIHGEPAPRGQMRRSCAWLVQSTRAQIFASVFAQRFLALAGRRPRTVSAQHWLQAYEEWLAVTVPRQQSALTINDAWRIAQDLRIGAWAGPDAEAAAVMLACGDCDRQYLVSAEVVRRRDCPYCGLLAKSRSWRAGAPAEPIESHHALLRAR